MLPPLGALPAPIILIIARRWVQRSREAPAIRGCSSTEALAQAGPPHIGAPLTLLCCSADCLQQSDVLTCLTRRQQGTLLKSDHPNPNWATSTRPLRPGHLRTPRRQTGGPPLGLSLPHALGHGTRTVHRRCRLHRVHRLCRCACLQMAALRFSLGAALTQAPPAPGYEGPAGDQAPETFLAQLAAARGVSTGMFQTGSTHGAQQR